MRAATPQSEWKVILWVGFAALLLSSVAYASEEEGAIVVDANSTPCLTPYAAHYTKIQDAINNSATQAGDTIRVCPGMYGEQLNVTKSVTIRGVTVPTANNGNGVGAAIITVPGGSLSSNATLFSTPLEAQVLVEAPNVILNDLTIDGTGALAAGACPHTLYVAGVYFAAGALRRLAAHGREESEHVERKHRILLRRGRGRRHSGGAELRRSRLQHLQLR